MSDYLGIYQGSVVDNNDILGIGRVTCMVPQAQADQPTTWCNPIYPTVYKPNVGDVVWVQFINGDLTKPIYFSSEAVTAEKIVAHTIEFDNLAGSAVSTIVANSVAAAKVSIGDQTNRVGDPFFDGTEPWIVQGSSLTFHTSSDAGVPAGSPKPTLVSTGITPSAVNEVTNNADHALHTFPVTPADVFRCFISGACGNTATNLFVGLWLYDKSMAHPTFVAGNLVVNGVTGAQGFAKAAVANTWATYNLQVTIPATISGGAIPYYAVPSFSVGAGVPWYLTNWQVFKANAGLLLVDGSILANGTVQGGTIIGPLFETTATANRGIKIAGSTFTAYDNTGLATVTIDGSTGDATVMGEFGTGPAGQAGVHISSTEFNGVFGQSTYPTVQFNIGSGVPTGFRQPQIFTDTTGTPNLYFWGGGATNVHMSQLKLDQGWARLGVEGSTNSDDLLDGDRLSIKPGDVFLASSGIIDFFNNTQSARQTIQALDVIADGALQSNGTIRSNTAFQFTNVAGSSFRAISAADVNATGNVTATGDVNSVNVNTTANVIAGGAMQNNGTFQAGTAFQFVNVAGTIFRALNAAAFNVSSDRSLKSNLKAPSIDALTAIRNLPVYEYTLEGQDSPTMGVMADDAPEIVSGTATLDSEVTKPSTQKDVKTLDLYALVAVLVQAVQDLDKQLDDVLPDRKTKKPTRKSRSLKG